MCIVCAESEVCWVLCAVHYWCSLELGVVRCFMLLCGCRMWFGCACRCGCVCVVDVCGWSGWCAFSVLEWCFCVVGVMSSWFGVFCCVLHVVVLCVFLAVRGVPSDAWVKQSALQWAGLVASPQSTGTHDAPDLPIGPVLRHKLQQESAPKSSKTSIGSCIHSISCRVLGGTHNLQQPSCPIATFFVRSCHIQTSQPPRTQCRKMQLRHGLKTYLNTGGR